MANWTLAQILAGEAKRTAADRRMSILKRDLARAREIPIRMMRVQYVEGAPRAVDEYVKQSQWEWSYSQGCRGIGVVDEGEASRSLNGVAEVKIEYVDYSRGFHHGNWERWCNESRPVVVPEPHLLQKERRLLARVMREVKGAKEALYESLGGACKVQYEGRTYEVKVVESRGIERVVVREHHDV